MKFSKNRVFGFLACLVLMSAVFLINTATATTGLTEKTRSGSASKRKEVVDHSEFDVLDQDFKSGSEVTESCLACHDESATQFMKTIHWTRFRPDASKGTKPGKAGLILNNSSILVPSNELNGNKDKNFDFSDETKVDCLICHEQTGTYKIFLSGAGNPSDNPTVIGTKKKIFYPLDYKKAAQSVGLPTRENCGTCHFFESDGDRVKHLDLDSSLTNPNREVDVHMAVDGPNFSCISCHTTIEHDIVGRIYTTPATRLDARLAEEGRANNITCESCHSETPHANKSENGSELNKHTEQVACQTCHIPTIVRGLPVKLRRDGPKARVRGTGGKFRVVKEPRGLTDDSMKGEFVWSMDVVPEYFWYNGSLEYVLADEKINPDKTMTLTRIMGDQDDPKSKLYPFIIHGEKQPYNKVSKTVIPGMNHAEVPDSSEYEFVETEYALPVNHIVAPREKALSCEDCHTENGRLANVAGLYLPGQGGPTNLNLFGWLVVAASLIGVLTHGLVRILFKNRNKKIIKVKGAGYESQ